MGSHNVEQFHKHQKAQGGLSRVLPRPNVIAAASYVRQLFENKKFTYGIMGGLEMLCLGHRRDILDVHITYDDKDFKQIKSKLEKDRRVQLPEGMNSLLPSTILVRTGPSYHDIGCTNPATIEVHLVPSGSYGTPPNGTLSNNLVLLSLKTDGVLKTYKGLNMLFLVKTLVYYCKIRDLAWDPRKDLVFLCRHYGAEVHTIHRQLDQRSIQQQFLVTAFLTRLPFADQRVCYQALVGQEPPPIMAVTPSALQDGHLRSQSASELPRTWVSPQNTPSTLKAQMSPEYLNPSRSGKTNTNTGSHFGKLYTPSTSFTDLASTTQDSRSRYRVVSAPNSSRNSPEVPQSQNASHPRTKDMRYMSQQQASRPLHCTQPSHTQQLVVDTENRAKSNFNQAATILPSSDHSATQKGLTLNGATRGNSLWHPSQRQHQVPSAAIPAPHNPGQQHLKPQPSSESSVIFKHIHAQSTPIIKKPVPPQARRVQQAPRQASIENSEPRIPQQQTGTLHLVSPDNEHTSLTQHVEAETNRLRLVGSEGLYQPLSRRPEQSSQFTLNTEPPPTSVFELDATPEGSGIVAELSADIDAAIKTSSAGQTPVQPNWYNDPTFLDSPVRPAHSRAVSTPLPASLTVGSSPPRRTSPPVSSLAQDAASNGNELGYSEPLRAFAPAPLAVYKAYQPQSSAPVLPPTFQSSLPISPPESALSEQRGRPKCFGQVQDVDGTHHYQKRSILHESPLTEHSTDASRLAMEYRAAMPDFGRGFSFRFKS